jgi:hypothetical protein
MSVRYVRESKDAHGGGVRRRALWMLLGLCSPGCVLDQDDLCGPNQVSWAGKERCVCAEGTAYTADGCVACGEHEQSSPNGCVCEAGFARSLPTQPCSPIPEGIGTACTSDAECLNPGYPYCQTSSAGDKYCTTIGCADSAGCNGGYACNTAATPPFCQRPPAGAGVPCTSDADCAGTEATFCDLFVSGTCLVRDCSVEPNSCFSGSECCDLSGFMLPKLCIPAGACQQ